VNLKTNTANGGGKVRLMDKENQYIQTSGLIAGKILSGVLQYNLNEKEPWDSKGVFVPYPNTLKENGIKGDPFRFKFVTYTKHDENTIDSVKFHGHCGNVIGLNFRGGPEGMIYNCNIDKKDYARREKGERVEKKYSSLPNFSVSFNYFEIPGYSMFLLNKVNDEDINDPLKPGMEYQPYKIQYYKIPLSISAMVREEMSTGFRKTFGLSFNWTPEITNSNITTLNRIIRFQTEFDLIRSYYLGFRVFPYEYDIVIKPEKKRFLHFNRVRCNLVEFNPNPQGSFGYKRICLKPAGISISKFLSYNEEIREEIITSISFFLAATSSKYVDTGIWYMHSALEHALIALELTHKFGIRSKRKCLAKRLEEFNSFMKWENEIETMFDDYLKREVLPIKYYRNRISHKNLIMGSDFGPSIEAFYESKEWLTAIIETLLLPIRRDYRYLKISFQKEI
jgi:hypothetical protein